MKNKRVSISKKLRFEVFKRDLFVCQYCGALPPSVVLEIDHINPVVRGGRNGIDNLITACFSCNRGKGKLELTSIPQSTEEKAKILKEKLAQYNSFLKLQNEMESNIQNQIDSFAIFYTSLYEGYELSESFLQSSVKKFILAIGLSEVKSAMATASSRVRNDRYAIKYFCGICWNKIKGT